MKRFFLIILATLMMIPFCSCGGNNDEIILEDGKKLAGKEAGNEVVEYSFTYPEEWTLIRNDGTIEIQFDCNESAAYAEYATVTVLAFTLSDSSQLANSYWEEHKKQFDGIYTDFKELDSEEITLDDTVALKVKYSGKLNDIVYVSEQIICCRYGSVYLVTLVSPEQYHDKVTSVISEVRENFKFA